MHADLFYETHCEDAVPLYLISQVQWDEGMESLSPTERNCFLSREFTGKLGDYCVINNANGHVAKVYIGSGLGNQEQALASAVKLIPPCSYEVQDELSHAAAANWALAQYRFEEYKPREVRARRLLVNTGDLKDILALTQSVFLVRDLINKPTNDMGPKDLASVMEHLSKTHGGDFKQWVGDELLRDNFPAIHAVGRASAAAPRLLSLTWGDETHPRIALVGKGVCFDTGGVNIKPAAGMRLMKKDMGGAAHVIGLAQWIMMRKLPVRLSVLVPAVENSIGPDAFRPGDVLTMRNGLTVEIDNTDAEGRLILADALVKACEDEPELIIDFATLTGAARIALGGDIAALFSNHDDLAANLIDASVKAADPMWRLPLHAPYTDYLRSTIADLTNCSATALAGAITAALFLEHFISKNIPWAHLDVMAWNTASSAGHPEGGEALGFRAVVEYLTRVYA